MFISPVILKKRLGKKKRVIFVPVQAGLKYFWDES